MKLRFTPRAIENINELADYLNERSSSAARNVRAAIYERLQTLLMFPRAGRRQNAEDVRKVVTRRYRYLIYYMHDEPGEEIIILNIKHPAEDREHEDP
ncbi:type II toxin-antitoxin system RelE/ParE family toxin [Labrys wisconsinensis]|uniref:Plasmid stabilization system protein ParE n=1 Tax=Labrys wisconsinensis TaxID=425677 RepID=A0ABU0J1P0_9HYPH|nr:type II toxin-antitoxin system RelE/ParE family toxin [Labrys wisconsinensis]MDQ0468171.1 plasmid stabilization system protein ParE [Labrys wisconsinensis]